MPAGAGSTFVDSSHIASAIEATPLAAPTATTF